MASSVFWSILCVERKNRKEKKNEYTIRTQLDFIG